MARLCFILIFYLISSTAYANILGDRLKQYCAFYPGQTESTTMCMGYIGGTLDTFRLFERMGTKLYCEPKEASGDQLIEMTKKYLVDHPSELHNTASSLILKMLIEAFPCQQKR
jgi:hypothetical protein